jgi:hypothetical protein
VAQSSDREDAGGHRRSSLAKIGAESESVAALFDARDDDSGAGRIARTLLYVVIAGHSRSKNGVASLAYDPAISITVARLSQWNRDDRDKPGHDKRRCLTSWIERTRTRMLRAARRCRGVFCYDGYSSRPRASFADDPIAAFADAADAETPHAGLLGRRGDAIVVHREPAFSEFHLHVLCSAGFVKG